MDPALIDRGNLMDGDWANYSVYESQNLFGAELQFKIRYSQRSSLSPTEGVNSIPPIQQNSLKNGYDENNNYNKSDENNCEINYSIITNNKWDVNTHINMQLTMHNKYTNDDIHTDACVVHIMR